MKEVYLLVKENYQGEYYVDVYAEEKNCKKAYLDLLNKCSKNEELEEFEENTPSRFSFFDPDINEFNTYIYYYKEEVK